MSWPIIASKDLLECKIFTVLERMTLAPHTGRTYPFYVLKARDWVITIPLTPDDHVVLVKQFRHGIREVTVEIPAGIIERGESPMEAAKRELLEETGCAASHMEEIGRIHSNPAFVENCCHVFLAEGVTQVSEPHCDETESIEVERVPISAIPHMITSGQMTHAVSIAAFHLLGLKR